MEIYRVGGAVRDRLLQQTSKDNDWVVVSATAAEMEAQGYIPIGKDFPVFLHPKTKEEYALARTERKQGHGYKGFQFYTDTSVTLEEDLERRDLTINAIAEASDGTLIDPYGGQQDIKKRLLRHVSEAFAEDPLRILRVARFAARFSHLGFQIAPETLTLMQQISASGELEHLTPERVWSEMERALASPSPQVFLEALQDSHALAHLVPEFSTLLESPQAATLKQRLQQAGSTDTDAAARLALICYYLPITSAQLSDLLQKLRTPKKVSELCLLSHELADQLLDITSLSAEQQLQLYKQLDLLRRPERANTLSTVCGLIKADQNIAKSCQQHLQNLAATLASIEPKALVDEGFKGAKLGAELHKRQLKKLKDAQL